MKKYLVPGSITVGVLLIGFLFTTIHTSKSWVEGTVCSTCYHPEYKVKGYASPPPYLCRNCGVFVFSKNIGHNHVIQVKRYHRCFLFRATSHLKFWNEEPKCFLGKTTYKVIGWKR
jgi:hypothetical protein